MGSTAERARQELKRAARSGAPVSLLMIDGNDFKRINDSFGHLAGDRALQAIANGIRARVRQYDLVGRIGGDEFAVLLPGMNGEAAGALIPRLLESIGEQPIEHEFRVTVSIGKASLVPGEVDAAGTGLGGSEEDEVLRRLVAAADGDLYGVKRTRY